ncbi:hypothetical protein ACFONG_03085 [Uliginosibacterium paludis]|uniref:Uncharacterized protein n=1 Tax=Uliginosibacterium paludis TaxID=1615952 RepID=A0ABV2CQ88_9RHOO
MYCIVFNGRVLDGHDPAQVRAAVAARMKLSATELDRLFSGRRAILRKNVPESSAQHYLSIVRGLGLNAALARMPAKAEARTRASGKFKVVFWGRVIDGFALIGVMRAAEQRFGLSREQTERLFEGDKVVLKRGLTAERASRYVRELALIGMVIELEEELQGAPVAAAPAPAKTVRRSAAGEEAFAGMLGTQFELPPTNDPAFASPDPGPVPVPAPPAAQARRAPSAAPSAAAPILASQERGHVRCSQCGHRQAWRPRCAVCGVNIDRRELDRRSLPKVPMDASAHATPTTVLGNMPVGLMRNSSAAPAAPAPSLREEMRKRQAGLAPAAETVRKAFIVEQQRRIVVVAVLLVALVCLLW